MDFHPDQFDPYPYVFLKSDEKCGAIVYTTMSGAKPGY